MNKKLQVLKYLFFDALSASLTWASFFVFRKIYIEAKPAKFADFMADSNFALGLIFIPLFWVTLYYLSGYYKGIYRKSRLQELWQTFGITYIGIIAIFFTLILDDQITSYKDYYESLLFIFFAHFLLTYIPRVTITSFTISRLRNRKIGFKTILIGSNEKALSLFQEFEKQKKSVGNKFVGFVSINDQKNPILEQFIHNLGEFDELENLILKNNIEEVIIALETSEHDEINRILNKLQLTNVIIKITPTTYDIITGLANIAALYGSPLVQVHNIAISVLQENIKRLMDVVASALAIILLSPLYIVTGLIVKLTSKGPMFFAQTRIGKNRKPFKIYKFRSMYINSEKNGPALSSKNDNRITKIGKFMRKTRLDEIPQFFNVLKGDMSLVGPRPERQFYIDQIVEKAPHYLKLHKIKPGVTSWGQVKFGYAENVEEMVERLKYDIIYLENMSIYADLKILIYTVKIVFQGSGK